MTATPVPHAPPAAPATRSRTTEAWLLLFALVLVAVALVLVQGTMDQPIGWELGKYVLAFVVLYGIAHAAVRWLAPYADPLLLPVVGALNGLGLVMIHRLDLTPRMGEPTSFANSQMMWVGVGIVVFVATLFLVRDHRTLSRYSYTLGLLGLILLILPVLLPNSERGGAKLWIQTPFFSIQPGEFAKILIIIFTASFLVSRRDLFTTVGKHVAGIDFPRARDLGPLLAAWAIAIGVLVLETDLGSSLLIFATMLTMLYIATERVSWLMMGLALFAAGATAAYFLFGHLQDRVSIWIDPFQSPDGAGMQILRSLFALAAGGMFGTGLGSGYPNEVPEIHNDFILAAFGEELGLFGLTAIVMLYLLIVMRGLRAAISVRDSFGKLLAAGLAFTIAIQLFVVLGGISKLIPMTGLTSPFLSYGGSSLLANYILIALLIRVSNAAREPDTPKKAPAAPISSLPTQVVRR
ncbi:cell division protein RodA [Gordonia hirsuta DSM 44140 = NBRC 16056]|uniref:Cell division protein RodA n=1 Tax=Gordonia hirsuta DSM 44140 = NBRC 16056 TaxID=1121927 RepID=L7L9V7_9ACTN|nr:cell division protein RodA [Gordonia hirsuta DSM 44140 = NBRC 16056]